MVCKCISITLTSSNGLISACKSISSRLSANFHELWSKTDDICSTTLFLFVPLTEALRWPWINNTIIYGSPTYHASSHDAPAWFSTRWDSHQSLARSACSWHGRGIVCTTTSIVALNAFYLVAFWAREKIFSWRCDSHFQGEMRRGDGATVLSGATIATNSHLQDTSWWVGPGWAGGGWWWCSSDDAEEEDEILKNWNRDFLYGNWYFKCQILKFRCLVVYYWTFNLGEGPFALASTTYMYMSCMFSHGV